MTKIDADGLEDSDEALLGLSAVDHSDAGMDEYLLNCQADAMGPS